MDEMTDAYVSAHIRINSAIPPEQWTDEQKYFAFAMLPAPGVSLDEFKAKFKAEPHIDEMSEEEKLEQNAKMIKLHKPELAEEAV
jgi:hypothetical protein